MPSWHYAYNKIYIYPTSGSAELTELTELDPQHPLYPPVEMDTTSACRMKASFIFSTFFNSTYRVHCSSDPIKIGSQLRWATGTLSTPPFNSWAHHVPRF